MLKRIGVLAVLAACSSQDDVTRVTAADPPANAGSGLGLGSSTGVPALGPIPSNATASGPTFSWATPPVSAGAAVSSGAMSSIATAPGTAAASTPVPASRAGVEEAARAQLVGPASPFRYAPERVAELTLRELHDTGVGAVIARFNRRVDGLEVFGQQVSVAMDRNLNPLAVSGDVSGVRPPLNKAAGAAGGFNLTPEQAVIGALADVTGVVLARSDLGPAQAASGSYEKIELGSAALSKLGAPAGSRPARAKMLLFPATSKQLLPAYYVEADAGADAEGKPRYFAHVISAVDGAILWKRDLTAYEAFSYRVYADDQGLFTPWDGPQGTALSPDPRGAPDADFSPDFVPSQRVTLSSLEAVGVKDPWLPDGARETVGNNVDAYLDISPPNGYTLGTDFRGQVSAPGEFDADFDPLVDANLNTEQQTAAVTQLFYDINWFHDWYYAAGFTEAAGNAQASNLDRGGLDGDPILAEAQDSSGFDNANMNTPADGESPRMQMYLWDFGPASLTVTGPQAVAGTYETGAAAFAPRHFDLSGPIVRANPVDACAPLQGDYTGAIVLIDRGGDACGASAFANKAANAQQAGAVGVVIANVSTSNNPDVPAKASGVPPFPITIGVLTVDLGDGDRLRAALADGSQLGGDLFRDVTLHDGDIDNQVIAHEWGHYISNRLVGDSMGLATNMSSGMGEGWGDVHALLITVRPEDATSPNNVDWSGVYPMGAYASHFAGPDSYYFGIRRYPYTTDMTRNPLTFKFISNDSPLPDGILHNGAGDNTEVHNLGEVWATMLWECYAALLRDTLGASPRLTFAEARDRMRDYIVAAYKLTPMNPTLLEARDALLAAALGRDQADLRLFGKAFAKRGAGVFAVAPDRFDVSNSGVVESYATGSALVPTAASLVDDVAPVCGADGILDTGEVGTLHVTFRNIGNAPSEASTATVSAAVSGVTFPDGALVNIPALPIFGTAEGSVRVALAGLTEVTPIEFAVQAPDTGAGLPAPKAFSFLTNEDELPQRSFTDTAESTHVVWTVDSTDPDSPQGSLWQRTALSTADHEYHCGGSQVAAVADFVSPPLAVKPGEAFKVSFKQRFSFEAGAGVNYDGGVIEISTDLGASWADVGEDVAGYDGSLFTDSGNLLGGRAGFVGDSPDYPDYSSTTLDFGSRYGGDTVLIRFRVSSDDGTSSVGWDLDDIAVSGVADAPFDAIEPQSSTCSEPTPAVP